MNYCKTKTVL